VGIVEEDIARVRSLTDFVHLASEHMALRKVGRRWEGLCPFHAERSPSFSLNAEEGLFYCFGCQAKGDVITFVRDIEHLDFVEAVEKLASRAGIVLRYDDNTDDRDHQKRARLYGILERAVEWYHERLKNGSDAAAARSYLRSRNYDGELVRRYRLGWAPEAWDALARALGGGDNDALMIDAGLIFRNKVGKLNDSFRGRVLFPIFDASGRAIGFGGRILVGGQGPKYKNTAETPVYSKSRTLYGLNWAKDAIVAGGQVVVCEGYTDVIGLHHVGVGEAIATCGTALADGHVRVLTNFARRIVLAYDADGAGQAAAERFYAWEQKFQADIAVAALPP
jgi:DNA primase